MADWPEVEVSDRDGNVSTWDSDGDRRRLVEGLRVWVDYVEHSVQMTIARPFEKSDARLRFEKEGAAIRRDRVLVVGIWVEDSPQRVDGIAPGPEGAGYDSVRRYGEATHYLRVPSRAAGETLLTEFEQDGRAGRVWSGGTADLWYVQIWARTEADARNEIAELDRLADSRGGRYDGGEVINGEVWGPLQPG